MNIPVQSISQDVEMLDGHHREEIFPSIKPCDPSYLLSVIEQSIHVSTAHRR